LLHDDWEAVRLDEALIAAPPIELWPQTVARVPIPEDVEQGLIGPLRREGQGTVSAMHKAHVLAIFLALSASAPAAEVGRKVTGAEKRRTTLQQRIDQASLPITAGEFLKTGAILAVATTILGAVALRTVTGAVLGGLIGPLAYWSYLGGRRDKTRRAYQEALARVATIARDVIGRGGSLKDLS